MSRFTEILFHKRVQLGKSSMVGRWETPKQHRHWNGKIFYKQHGTVHCYVWLMEGTFWELNIATEERTIVIVHRYMIVHLQLVDSKYDHVNWQFPTCQVRASRFYQTSCPPPPPSDSTSSASDFASASTASSRAQRALPDLNHELQSSLPDFNSELQISAGP